MSGILDKIIESQQAEVVLKTSPTELLSRLLEQLREREREVLTRRFALKKDAATGQTLKEIGDALGVTRERVRQIESSAIKRLRQLQEAGALKEEIDSLTLVLRRVLERYGGIMEHDHFILNAHAAATGVSSRDSSEMDEATRRAFAFFITHLFHEVFEPLSEDHELKAGWKLPIAEMSVCRATVAAAKEVLKRHATPLDFALLLQDVAEGTTTTVEHCEAHLHLARDVKPNAFGQWGLSHWPEVTPRRINDKIFLVLKRAGGPLHFMEIAERINGAKFDEKSAHPATVHNELIFDDRYVLVGRGIYALAEWGYEPGVVSDVIAGILKKSSEPLHRDAIVDAVMKQRLVRRSTVLLALTDQERFCRLPDGTYTLTARAA